MRSDTPRIPPDSPLAGVLELRWATPEDWTLVVHSWRCSWEPHALSALEPTAAGLGEHLREAGLEPLQSEQVAPVALRALSFLYRERFNARAERLLRRGACLLAVSAEDAAQIAGYVVVDLEARGGPVVHWAYVKSLYRRHGLAGLLLDSLHVGGARYTHHTPAGVRLVARLRARYSPEAADDGRRRSGGAKAPRGGLHHRGEPGEGADAQGGGGPGDAPRD